MDNSFINGKDVVREILLGFWIMGNYRDRVGKQCEGTAIEAQALDGEWQNVEKIRKVA